MVGKCAKGLLELFEGDPGVSEKGVRVQVMGVDLDADSMDFVFELVGPAEIIGFLLNEEYF